MRTRAVLAAFVLLVPITLSAVAFMGGPLPAVAGFNLPSPRSPITPGTVSAQSAWEGIDYNQTCSGCLPADPQVAAGAGYILEVVNASYAVWTPGGTLQVTKTLSALFGSGPDLLSDPQVRFDGGSLRWFVSVDDLHNDQILFAASDTSDPTGSWNVQHFNLPGGTFPELSLLAVNKVNLVVATNLFSRATLAFQGSQVWVANKTQLIGTGPVAMWSSPVNQSEDWLTPAQPLIGSSTLYLVTDGAGGSSQLGLLSLTGTPPATPVLSSPTNFTTTTTTPPNAGQNGTSDLLDVGGGRIQSAVWRSGNLWAVAADGCTPSGDSVLRSCLHLWEIGTAGRTLEQDYVWSTGAGTYDFYPALSTDASGDLTVEFGESSASTFPAIEITGHTNADPNGTLETASLLKQGGAPDAPASHCAAGVCPFGTYFGVAFEPLSGDRFWVAGEYVGNNSTSNLWQTWIASVTTVVAYPVEFQESGLASGTNWSVTVNGITKHASSSTISFLEPNGSYSYSLGSPISGGFGIQYVPSPADATFVVSNASVDLTIEFTTQYSLSTSSAPLQAGEVEPSTAWVDANSSVLLGAFANSSYAFETWAGQGPGAYSGTSNPVSIEAVGPISEQAKFVRSTTYSVVFRAAGLPHATSWSVSLNGLVQSSASARISFNATNGSYTYSVATPISGGPGVEYLGAPTGGSFSLTGSNQSIAVSFATEYQLTVNVLPAGAGSVAPATGFFPAGVTVNVSALPQSGYSFVSWTGSGAGNYSGPANPAPVTPGGPVAETANLEPTTVRTFPVTFGVAPAHSGSIDFDGQIYSGGQTVTVPVGTYALSETPAPGWVFNDWSTGGSAVIGLGVSNISGAAWINATFAKVGLVTVVTVPATCGSVSVGGNVYANGASVSLLPGEYPVSAQACVNYTLLSIQGSGSVSVTGSQVTVRGDGNLVATFAPVSTASHPFSWTQAITASWFALLAVGVVLLAIALFVTGRRRSPPSTAVPPPGVVPGTFVGRTEEGSGSGGSSTPPWSENDEAG